MSGLLPEHYPVDVSSLDVDPRAESDEPELIEIRICWSCETDWPCEAALAEVPD